MLQTAVLHVQSAQRAEVNAGDILAAILQQDKSQAARLLGAQGVTRLDILDYISHGIAKTPRTPGSADAERPGRAVRRRRRGTGHVRAIRCRPTA